MLLRSRRLRGEAEKERDAGSSGPESADEDRHGTGPLTKGRRARAPTKERTEGPSTEETPNRGRRRQRTSMEATEGSTEARTDIALAKSLRGRTTTSSSSSPTAAAQWLLRAEDVPACMREPFVLEGYRPETPHWPAVVATLGHWHNQTGEIYTHLIPLVLYSAAGAWTVAQLPAAATPVDVALFALYFAGVAACFACSSLYHLGACHSEQAHDWLYRVDRAGIVAPFFASMVFLTYYNFACDPFYRRLHIAAAVVTSGLVLGMILWGPEDARYVTRWLRVSVSLAMFSVGLASVVHMAVTVPYGADLAWRFAGTYLAYGIGVVFYVTHFPERWRPGRFDMLGKSHQIWHVCVVVGAANFYFLVLECFDAYLVHAPCR